MKRLHSRSSRARTAPGTGRRSAAAWTSSPGCCVESRFDADYPMTGLEIELNLVDENGDPALKNGRSLEAIANPDFQTELGQFNLEINVPPKQLRRPRLHRVRGGRPRQPQRRAGQGGGGRRPHGDDRHPADPRRRAHGPGLAQHQPAVPAAQRPDPGGPRRGHRHRHRWPRTAPVDRGFHRPRGCVHQHPAAHPGQPRRTSRRTGTPHKPSPGSSSPWARTRRSCWAASSGGRPGSRCSSRPRTLGARS